MNTLNRFKAPLVLATVLALPILANCSAVEDAQGAVCCTEFKAGGTVDAKIGGNADALVAVQAISDFSALGAAIDDITTACRSIATDLDADKAASDKAEQTADKRDRMKAWCELAVSTIGTFKGKAGGTLSVVVQPPMCQASISAKANCTAKCSGGSASCDVKATPPVCTGGSLEVSCKGGCTAKAGAELKCEGGCTGMCKGSCTAEGGVMCAGTCEGTCEGNTANGAASGKCEGMCKGTCSVTAPSVMCSGSCSGTCSAKCEAKAGATVKCDGTCDADFEPLKCEGGTIEGGCKVESPKCNGNCDASVSAKAECTPPSIAVAFTGAADVTAAARIQATFEANLPLIFAFKARLEGMAKLTATITGNADVIVDIKAACILQVGAAAAAAVLDVTAAGTATASLVTAAK